MFEGFYIAATKTPCEVLSRCVLVPDAAEHIPKVWGAAEQGGNNTDW